MVPQIALREGVAETEIAPENSNFAGQTIQIVDGNVDTAVRLLRHPDGLRAASHLDGGEAGLIDDDEFVIREGRLGQIIGFGEISTEIHGGVRHRPNSDRSLLLHVTEAIDPALPTTQPPHVIPSHSRTRSSLPA